MKKIIGKCKTQKSNSLFITTLGSNMSKKSDFYNPCIEVEFECPDDALRLYGFDVIVEVEEDKFTKSSKKNYVKVKFSDCTFKKLSKKEYETESIKFKKRCAGRI